MSAVIEYGRSTFKFALTFWLVSVVLNMLFISLGLSPITSFGVGTTQSVIEAARGLNQTGAAIGQFANPWPGINVFVTIVGALLGIIAGIPLLLYNVCAFLGNPTITAIALTIGSILQAFAWFYLFVWLLKRGEV